MLIGCLCKALIHCSTRLLKRAHRMKHLQCSKQAADCAVCAADTQTVFSVQHNRPGHKPPQSLPVTYDCSPWCWLITTCGWMQSNRKAAKLEEQNRPHAFLGFNFLQFSTSAAFRLDLKVCPQILVFKVVKSCRTSVSMNQTEIMDRKRLKMSSSTKSHSASSVSSLYEACLQLVTLSFSKSPKSPP